MTRVALITGATSDIGAAAARALAKDGYAVVLTARRKDVLDDVRSQITSAGGEALAIAADVTDIDAVDDVVRRAVDAYGGLDVAFNNAGGSRGLAPLAQLDPAVFDELMHVNAYGIFYAMRAEIRAMLERGGGAIVNMSSTGGLRGVAGLGAYAAAKHAIVGLSRAAALDYAASGVRINVIAPGPIATERVAVDQRSRIAESVPMKRIGEPDEVAELVRWLCSKQSQFITGAVVPIDGGQLAGVPARSG